MDKTVIGSFTFLMKSIQASLIRGIKVRASLSKSCRNQDKEDACLIPKDFVTTYLPPTPFLEKEKKTAVAIR